MSKHHLNTPLRYGAQSIVQPEACSFQPTESIENFVLWVMIKKFMGIVQTQTTAEPRWSSECGGRGGPLFEKVSGTIPQKDSWPPKIILYSGVRIDRVHLQ